MARRSAPPSSRWVANEWRSACGWASTSAGDCAAACRAHVRSRRRTSEVPSRRPDLDRNSARSMPGRPGRGERAPGSAPARAARAPRRGRCASSRPCLRPAPSRRRSRPTRVRARPAPRRADPRHRRARTARGRAARAASWPGMRSSSAGDLRGLQYPREALGALGRAEQVGRVVGARALLPEDAEQRAQGGELARHRGRRVPALGQARGVAAQRPDLDRRRLQARGAGPGGELAGVDPVRPPGLGGHGATAQVSVERLQRSAQESVSSMLSVAVDIATPLFGAGAPHPSAM